MPYKYSVVRSNFQKVRTCLRKFIFCFLARKVTGVIDGLSDKILLKGHCHIEGINYQTNSWMFHHLEMLLRLFIIFYNLEIVDEEVFLNWKEDLNDSYPGKRKVLIPGNIMSKILCAHKNVSPPHWMKLPSFEFWFLCRFSVYIITRPNSCLPYILILVRILIMQNSAHHWWSWMLSRRISRTVCEVTYDDWQYGDHPSTI